MGPDKRAHGSQIHKLGQSTMSFALNPNRRIATGAALVAITMAIIFAYLFASGSIGTSTGRHVYATSETKALNARLSKLEGQLAQLSNQLAALSTSSAHPAATPEQIRRKIEKREHSRRMQEDPAYERQVLEQRLASLNQQFVSEPIDHRWTTETRAFTADALAAAAQRAGANVASSEIDCRSTTCRIKIDVDRQHSYDDVVTYLMTDLAETLPNARYVVMPPKSGIRSVNIFARRPDAK